MQPLKPASDKGRIAGRVLDAQGQPVSEAVVMIADGPPHPDIAALTGEKGAYDFIGLLPGEYSVLVNAAGREPARQSVTVAAGETTELDFRLA